MLNIQTCDYYRFLRSFTMFGIRLAAFFLCFLIEIFHFEPVLTFKFNTRLLAQ